MNTGGINNGGIDAQRIASMLAQLRAASQRPEAAQTALSPAALVETAANPSTSTKQVNFSDALKASLNQVNAMQLDAEKVGKNFAMGNDDVSLSDVMIAGQKANIAFQATIQVRNKLVSAYQEMMNMQI